MAAAIIHSLRPIVDTNGIPLSGALIYVYDATTTNLRAIYSDSGLSIAAANPIVCVGGFCPLRYTGAGSYKLTVTKADGSALTAYSGDNLDTGVAVGSGALPVTSGGSGATTPGGARTNFGVPSQGEVDAISVTVAAHESSLNGTAATGIASGTTAQRSASPVARYIRYNSTLLKFEGYIASWLPFLRSGDVTTSELPVNALLNYGYAETAVSADANTAIPYDDTAPLIAEGAELLTLSFTPSSATSKVRVRFMGCASCATGANVTVALFRGTTCIQVSSSVATGGNVFETYAIEYMDSPGVATAVTYSIRYGTAAGNNVRFNGASSARLYGGAMKATLTCEEFRV